MNNCINKCLLCLSHNKNIKNVLSKDNEGISVEEKLKYILPEEIITLWYNKIIKFKPHTLKHICIDCLNDLNHVYKFKQKCFKSLKSLNNFIEETTEEQLMYHKEHRILSDNTTNDTKNSTKLKDKILDASDEVQENNEEKVVIKVEPQDILSDSDNLEEEETNSNRNSLEEVIVKGEPTDFLDEYNINDDPLVPKETFTEDILDDTKNNAGDNTTSSETFTKKLHKCSECQKQFTRGSHLNKHKLIHTGEKPYKCDVCSKAFNQQSSLVTHKRIHTGEKSYYCELCSYVCTTKRLLKCHIQRRHTSDLSTPVKPYECSECDSAFTSKSKLETHNRIHTGEKPYACELCAYRCIRSADLKSHIRRKHTDTSEKAT